MRRQVGSISFRMSIGTWIYLSSLLILSAPELRAGAPPQGIIEYHTGTEQKTISREPDPIIICGEKLLSVKGLMPESFGLFAVKDNRLVPIPFQVDPKDERGRYVLTAMEDGKRNLSRPFDENDEVVFMAKDLGDRCLPELLPRDRQVGVEIEIIDPVDRTRGWSYLFAFAGPPVRSEHTYTRYLWPAEGKDLVHTNVFSMEFPPTHLKRAHSCRGLRIRRSAGGSGENLLDRLKTRVQLKFLFSLFKMNLTEDSLRSELVAYKAGPVRVLRRTKLFIPLGLGLKSPGFMSDFHFYETMMTAPMDFSIPFKLGSVFSSVTMRIGFDYLPVLSGSRFYNSLNLQGFTVDGRSSPEERSMDNGEAKWNLLTGPMGTVMRRNLKIGFSRKYFRIEEYVWDNVNKPDLPEGSPGNFGHSYQLWDVTDLPRGNYKLNQYFFVLPNFQWGDQFRYLKIHDDPLQVVVHVLRFPSTKTDGEARIQQGYRPAR